MKVIVQYPRGIIGRFMHIFFTLGRQNYDEKTAVKFQETFVEMKNLTAFNSRMLCDETSILFV